MRKLDRHGVRLVVTCFAEVRDWWNRYCAARAYQRERAGEAVGGGEKKGAGASLARALCWLSSLCDGDLDRIDREGGAILEALEQLPEEYGRVPGRSDPVTIRRRIGSVFARPGSEAGNPIPLKPIGVHHHVMGDQPQAEGIAAEGDGAPVPGS